MQDIWKHFRSRVICLMICLLPVAIATCPPDQFACMNTQICISQDLVNNTVNDCGDNSDEGAPPRSSCTSDASKLKFKCGSGECTSLDWYLDGTADCSDKSDEYKVIGLRCSLSKDSCCPCNETVANSTCTPVDPRYAFKSMNGVCRCISGWRNNSLGTECIQRQIGDACDVDPDCFDAVPNTVCTSGQCRCAPDCYLNPNNTNQCIRRKINDTCKQANDCSLAVNESTCLSNRCQCNHGYEPTKDLLLCVIPLIYAFECSSDSECQLHFNNTFCSPDGLCLCSPAFYPDSSRRTCIRYKLDSPCNSSRACQASLNNTLCVGQRCACSTGFYGANPQLCLPRTIGMDGCLTDADCAAVSNSRCSSSGICVCQPGYRTRDDNTTCSKRMIGDQCQSLGDCTAAVSQSVCVGGKCRCELGYRETDDRRMCLVLKVGDECQKDSECQRAMENSRCSAEHKCVCKAGYEPTDTRSGCRRAPVDHIGCYNDSSCQSLVRNSVCSGTGYCVCAKGYYPDIEGTGCALLQVGVLPCNSDERCSKAMNSTVCSPSGVCVCVPGYYPNIASNHCVNVILGKTDCTDDDTCSSAVYKAACVDGRCQCAVGYKALAGRSCVATQLGQACQRDDHCAAFIEHSICLNQTCVCAHGFNTTDDITCRPVPSDHTSLCVLPSLCPGWCAALIGFFFGTLLASAILGGILWKKKLKKRLRNKRRVGPLGMPHGMNDKWQLDWNNRPPAHIPVMYKSPSMKAPDELYGDLLTFDFSGVLFAPPETKIPARLPAS